MKTLEWPWTRQLQRTLPWKVIQVNFHHSVSQWQMFLDLESDALWALRDRYNQHEGASQQEQKPWAKTIHFSWVTSTQVPPDRRKENLYSLSLSCSWLPYTLSLLYLPCWNVLCQLWTKHRKYLSREMSQCNNCSWMSKKEHTPHFKIVTRLHSWVTHCHRWIRAALNFWTPGSTSLISDN